MVDGTIHDKDAVFTWDDAFAVKVAFLNTVGFAGHNDWRLPNKRELASLLDENAASPAIAPAFNDACAPSCSEITCSCTPSSPAQWTSTTYILIASHAWYVFFNDGGISEFPKSTTLGVRAVRGGF